MIKKKLSEISSKVFGKNKDSQINKVNKHSHKHNEDLISLKENQKETQTNKKEVDIETEEIVLPPYVIEKIPMASIKLGNTLERNHTPDQIKILADSVKDHGQNTPIDVIDEATHYELIHGEGRFRAHQLLNLEEITARIFPKTLSFLERKRKNIQGNLHSAVPVWDRVAYQYDLLNSKKVTQEEIVKLYKHEETVQNITQNLKAFKAIKEQNFLTFKDTHSFTAVSEVVSSNLSIEQQEKLLKTSKGQSVKKIKQEIAKISKEKGRVRRITLKAVTKTLEHYCNRLPEWSEENKQKLSSSPEFQSFVKLIQSVQS